MKPTKAYEEKRTTFTCPHCGKHNKQHTPQRVEELACVKCNGAVRIYYGHREEK